MVALPEGPEYRSEVLPEVILDLEEFWSVVAHRAAALSEGENTRDPRDSS